MNIYSKDIMKLLGVDEKMANEVQDKMLCDFSECTQQEFNKEAKITYKLLKEGV